MHEGTEQPRSDAMGRMVFALHAPMAGRTAEGLYRQCSSMGR
jgi:hypothetical protein